MALRKILGTHSPAWLRRYVKEQSPAWFRRYIKEQTEFSFWNDKYHTERILCNDHYHFLYTDLFGLSDEYYCDLRMLDVGCGPRGSLEWANMTAERIGLDPLARRYRSLGIDAHKMTYCCAPVEKIPFTDQYFDVVSSLNSLDHVDDLDTAIREVTRVLKLGRVFLLITEVNHPPTPAEPVDISEEQLRDKLLRTYEIQDWRAYEIRKDHDIYRSIREGNPRNSLAVGAAGIVVARMNRTS